MHPLAMVQGHLAALEDSTRANDLDRVCHHEFAREETYQVIRAHCARWKLALPESVRRR